jgi:hypothetical protein
VTRENNSDIWERETRPSNELSINILASDWTNDTVRLTPVFHPRIVKLNSSN